MNSPEVSNVLNLIGQARMDEAVAEMERLHGKADQLEGYYLVLGILCSSIDFNFLAFDSLEREQSNFGLNEVTQNFFQQLEDKRRSTSLKQQPKRVSVIVWAKSSPARYERTIRSLLWQGYTNLEIILLSRTSDLNEAKNLCLRYPTIALLEVPESRVGNTLNAAIINSSGEITTVITEPDTIWRDSGIFIAAGLFHEISDISVLTGERVSLSPAGLPKPIRKHAFTWSRATLLSETNLFPPVVRLPLTGTFFRSSRFKEANGFSEDVVDALDLDLFAKLSRIVPIHSVVASLVCSPVQFELKGEQVSLNYIGEGLSLLARERKVEPTPRSQDGPPPPITITNSSTANSESSGGKTPHTSQTRVELIIRKPLRISVVTPVFNQIDYIEECMDSVLSQNWPNLEYVVLDGGSSDGSLEVVKKYARHLSHWESGPDGGHYFAVQKGLKKSTGDIVTWLNSDDVFLPGSFLTAVDLMNSDSTVQWITGRLGLIDLNGKRTLGEKIYSFSRSELLKGNFDDPFIQQEGTFWTRELWEKAGGSLDLRWKYAADLELWCRFSRYASLHSVDSTLAYFRELPTQRSRMFRTSYYHEADMIILFENERVREGSVVESFTPGRVLSSN